MDDNFEALYRAVESRDTRFDGRLFIAVTSTKIYCRPICPTLMPKRRNVRFYRYAAVAEVAGFRPCRRCRPETSPDSPEWDVRSDLVGRGLRLIADGVADRHGTAALAGRLGVSARHLQRVFKAGVGVTPGVLARSRRAKLARQLLAESDLPVTEVAFAAGFSSVRAFNETMQKLYKVTPSELRRNTNTPPGTTSLRLSYRPPLPTASLLRFLEARAIPGVEEVTADRYRRSIRFGSGSAILELAQSDRDSFAMSLETDEVGPLAHVVQQARRLLDLDADPDAIHRDLASADLPPPLIDTLPGLRLPGAWDGFELGVRAILGQQVSVVAASTVAGRFAAMYGSALTTTSASITTLFPDAAIVARADLSDLGVPARRRDSISAFAEAVASRTVVLDGSEVPDRVVRALLDLPGIGPWTAQYIAMRALRDPDAFPDRDLGLVRAMDAQEGSGESHKATANQWRPWRGYAAMYLWQSLRPEPAPR